MTSQSARDILTFPYWPTDKTQNPNLIPGSILQNELIDLRINLEPGRTDYNNNFVPVLMRPAIGQDTSQMGNLADHPTYGVTNPGGLYADLLASVPDPNAQGKQTGKKGGAQNGS